MIRTLTAASAGLLAVLLLAPLHGQTARPGAARSPSIARMPWGHPDLQGRWTTATLTPLERPASLGAKEFFTEPEAAEYKKIALEQFLRQNNLVDEAAIGGEFDEGVWAEDRSIVPTLRTSLIVGPSGRLPPLTADGQRRAAARAVVRRADPMDHPEDRPLGERCLWFPVQGPPMLPSIVYNSNYEIVQTPTHVIIQVEMGGGVRIIPIDGRPHAPATVRQWTGDSRGRWDGDTLIVETTNFSGKRDFRNATENMRVVERFTRASATMIRYEVTVEDPATWTTPWTAEIPMTPLDGLLYEYACHEGNRSLENVLRGARATEARTTK